MYDRQSEGVLCRRKTPEAAIRVRNPYSDYGYYFLTENDEAPLTISEELLKAVCYPSPNDYHSLYEVDDYAWYHGGRNLYDKTLFTLGSPQKYELTANGAAGMLTVALTYDANFEATIAVNDSVVGSVSKQVRLAPGTERTPSPSHRRLERLCALTICR